MDPDLSVNIGGIAMANPVMTASGTFGYGSEYAAVVDVKRLGALVTKGVSSFPWEGNRPPRILEVPGGMLNAIGLQNPGVDAFIADSMPQLRHFGVPVVVNVWGRTQDEYVEVVRRLSDVDGVAGIELNISCPNIRHGGIAFGTDLRMAGDVIGAVRAATSLPLIPKLSPNVSQIADFARVAQDQGANAISLINSMPAMAIDIESRRPILANRTGGLTGRAIHPIAVRMVWEAAQAVTIPIVGMGGVAEPEDAIELMVVGATAVAVGTATFADPLTALRVVDGIRDYMLRHGFSRVPQLVGTVRP